MSQPLNVADAAVRRVADNRFGRRPIDEIQSALPLTGNSCRSQIAVGWVRRPLGDRIGRTRRGLKPRVEPQRRPRDARGGCRHLGHTSKLVGALADMQLDLVITVCGHADETDRRFWARLAWCMSASTIYRSSLDGCQRRRGARALTPRARRDPQVCRDRAESVLVNRRCAARGGGSSGTGGWLERPPSYASSQKPSRGSARSCCESTEKNHDAIHRAATRMLFFSGKGASARPRWRVPLLGVWQTVASASCWSAPILPQTWGSFGIEVDAHEPVPVTDVPGLFVLNINPEAAAQEYRDRIIGRCGTSCRVKSSMGWKNNSRCLHHGDLRLRRVHRTADRAAR